MATANKNYNIAVEINTKDANKGYKQVVSYINDIKKEAKGMNTSVDKSLQYDTKGAKRNLKLVENSFDDISREAKKSSKSVSNSLDQMKKSASGLKDNFETVRNGVGAVSVVALGAGTAIASYAKRAGEAAVEIQYLSQVSGVGVERFQELAYGARTVGIEQDKLADIFKDARDRVGDFIQTGGGPMADFFEKIAPQIGVTSKEFQNLTGPQIMQKYVSSLEEANVSQEDMVFYMEQMASDSTRLLPLLENMGSKWYDLSRESSSFGTNLSKFEVKKLTEVNENFNKMSSVIDGTLNGLIASFSDEINTAMNNAATNSQNMARYLIDVRDRLTEISDLDMGQAQKRKADLSIEERGRDNGLLGDVKDFGRNLLKYTNPIGYVANELNMNWIKTTGEVREEISLLDNQIEKSIKTKNLAIESQELFNNFTENSKWVLNNQSDAIKENGKVVSETAINSSNKLIEFSNNVSRMGYETGLGIQKIQEIIKDIDANNLYDFYDTYSQKVNAYIKDNDLQIKSNSSLSSSTSNLSNEKDKLRDSITNEIKTLEESIATFGKSEAEVIKYRIANGDLSEVISELGLEGKNATEYLLQLTNAMSAKEANATLKDEVKSLSNELKAMKLGGGDLIEFNAMNEYSEQLKVGGEEAQKSFNEIVSLRQELERQGVANNFMEQAKTDVQNLQEELKELNSVKDLLSPEDYNKLSSEIQSNIEMAKIEADDFLSFMHETGKELRGAFTDAIESGLDGDFESMFDSLQSTIRRKVAEILADQAINQLTNLLGGFGGGMGGGSSSGIMSFVSGLFGGRSAGGYMSPNKPYIVGEKGPEVVYPNNPSSVLNRQNSGGKSDRPININIGSVNGSNQQEVDQTVAKMRQGVAKAYQEAVSRGDV